MLAETYSDPNVQVLGQRSVGIDLELEVILVQQPNYTGSPAPLYLGWTVFIIAVIVVLVFAVFIQLLAPVISKCRQKRKRNDEEARSEASLESYEGGLLERDASAKEHRVSLPEEIITSADIVKEHSNVDTCEDKINVLRPYEDEFLASLEQIATGKV